MTSKNQAMVTVYVVLFGGVDMAERLVKSEAERLANDLNAKFSDGATVTERRVTGYNVEVLVNFVDAQGRLTQSTRKVRDIRYDANGSLIGTVTHQGAPTPLTNLTSNNRAWVFTEGPQSLC
jgi:hypothetical protein